MQGMFWRAGVIVAVMLSAGCSFFGKRSSYEEARESRPLEVPPDLDLPSTASGLQIPETGTPTGGSSPASTPPASSIAAGSESTLRVGDSVSGTWKRIGLALERSQVARVVSSDESAATWTVSGASTLTRTERKGFFGRLFGKDEKTSTETAEVTRVVRVLPEGEASRVRVEDESGAQADDELARRVIAALKQRLG